MSYPIISSAVLASSVASTFISGKCGPKKYGCGGSNSMFSSLIHACRTMSCGRIGLSPNNFVEIRKSLFCGVSSLRIVQVLSVYTTK